MVAHLSLTINSSANFLIYVVWGTKFRNIKTGAFRGYNS
jgi:hypothetical protein